MKNPYSKNTLLSNAFGYLSLNTHKQPMPLADLAEALQENYSAMYTAFSRDKAIGKLQCRKFEGKLCVALPGYDFTATKPTEQPAPTPEPTTNEELEQHAKQAESTKDEPEPIERPETVVGSALADALEKLRNTAPSSFIMVEESTLETELNPVRVTWDNIDGITVSGPDGSVKLDDNAIYTLQRLFNFQSLLSKSEI